MRFFLGRGEDGCPDCRLTWSLIQAQKDPVVAVREHAIRAANMTVERCWELRILLLDEEKYMEYKRNTKERRHVNMNIMYHCNIYDTCSRCMLGGPFQMCFCLTDLILTLFTCT